MFRFKNTSSFNANIVGATRRLLCIITVIIIIMSITVPVFAAERDSASPSTTNYCAVVKYGVNMRDASGNFIRYLPAGTSVQVTGVNRKDSSRFDILYGNTSGNVLAAGVKKTTNNTLSYSGKSYYGKVKYYLNVRDKNGNVVGTITQGEVVHVLGTYNQDSSRVVFEWKNGQQCTVLKCGLMEVNYTTGTTGKSYYAVITNGVNLRKSNGEFICYLPKNSLVHVMGGNAKDGNRVDVSFYDIEGNILASGVKRVDDAVFLSIYRQTSTLIVDGKLIAQSPVVTGIEGEVYRRPTRRGEFRVEFMQRYRTLNGTNYKGIDYSVPVEYWVRIYGHTGFHTADRDSFGGNIYKTNGSNGCINSPTPFAKALFENAYIGMPVYIA